MTPRRPRTAAGSNALPSLAALLASGVAVEGCDTAAQTAERARRLTAHGEQAGRALDNHQAGLAATEVARGLGLLESPSETRVAVAGESSVVEVTPPVPTAGAPAPTQPTPPAPSPVDVDGGVRQVDPTPPPPAPVGATDNPMHALGGPVSATPRPPRGR